MSHQLSFHEVADEVFSSPLANYLEYGIPVGTFIPDSELAPSRATYKVILRHRRLVFFTFDELGKPKWELGELNYLGEPMSEVCPGVSYSARTCRANRNTDLFCDFKNLELEEFERTAFDYLAMKHQLDQRWNWPTYEMMRAEPYRRGLRLAQMDRLRRGNYIVPTFSDAGIQDDRQINTFMRRLDGIREWEMEERFEIETQTDDRKGSIYAAQRFQIVSRQVDMLQKLLHNTQLACPELMETTYVPRVSPRPKKVMTRYIHDVPDQLGQ